jgi:hypothetical protein
MAKADVRQFRRFSKRGNLMQKLFIALAALALLATAIPAKAGSCTTHCNRDSFGNSTCHTTCY